MFYITRQRYWHDEEGRTCIELTNNQDAIGPGCLVEGWEEFDDPRDAALRAIEIQEASDEDCPITIGSIMLYGNPDDGLTVEEVNEWAERNWAALEKCDHCGGLIGSESYTHEWAEWNTHFCREYCAEMDYERITDECASEG